MGADGVAIGKPYLYGLAAGGRVGVHKVRARGPEKRNEACPEALAMAARLAASCVPWNSGLILTLSLALHLLGHQVVSLLGDELERAMGLLGVATVAELKERGPTLVKRRIS